MARIKDQIKRLFGGDWTGNERLAKWKLRLFEYIIFSGKALRKLVSLGGVSIAGGRRWLFRASHPISGCVRLRSFPVD
jgi:hypothetical protein